MFVVFLLVCEMDRDNRKRDHPSEDEENAMASRVAKKRRLDGEDSSSSCNCSRCSSPIHFEENDESARSNPPDAPTENQNAPVAPPDSSNNPEPPKTEDTPRDRNNSPVHQPILRYRNLRDIDIDETDSDSCGIYTDWEGAFSEEEFELRLSDTSEDAHGSGTESTGEAPNEYLIWALTWNTKMAACKVHRSCGHLSCFTC